MMLTIAILAATALIGGLLWIPNLRSHPTWRAMVTPLASIIGSGFLVLGPILEHAYGGWAPMVMLLLCVVAWGFGAAIRHNIAGIDATPARAAIWPEHLASALLGFAFTISVAYYLNLFGSFALSLTPWETDLNRRLMTSAVYAVILFMGFTRGFQMLERMEYVTVSLKLAIIAGLLVGLAQFNISGLQNGSLHFGGYEISGWAAVTLAFGLIVTVQGFETSRYLSGEYDARTRIRSMRLAQGIANGIYLVYILLVAYAFEPDGIALTETAIVDMMGIVAPILPVLLVAAALAAQFSAAVADTGGSGGLIEELTRQRIPTKWAYLLIGAVGLILTWTSDVFQIIAYASRAFALYYAVQAAIAARISWKNQPAKTLIFGALALLGLLIAVFGQSVE